MQLNSLIIICRNCTVGCYALRGEAAENKFKARNQDIKKKGSLAGATISSAEWSYGLNALHYC